jgi:3-methyladenine DNA glycosylase AlkD
LPQEVEAIVAELKRLAKKSVRDGMLRYGIPNDNAFGIRVGTMQKLAKRLGRSHKLAAELWATGWYEARMMAAFVDEPDQVTPAQMDRWCRDFDSWAICDTVCFHLFDRTPYAWDKIKPWARRKDEFVRRAGYALLACLALHDKQAEDESFVPFLPLIERGATDGRNLVKKGVSWALRGIGRRSAGLHAPAVAVAKRLAESTEPAARWVGKDALRDLTRPAVIRRFR